MTHNERIRIIRKELNLTMEQFGEKLGVTKSTISNIENGNRSATEQIKKSICSVYNVNYDFLAYGEGEMFQELPKTVLDQLCIDFDCDEYDKAILTEYLKLNRSERDVIKNYLKNISEHFN